MQSNTQTKYMQVLAYTPLAIYVHDINDAIIRDLRTAKPIQWIQKPQDGQQ